LSIPDSITDIAVLIPAYNPDDRLLDLVKELTALGLEHIVIVNDGSGREHATIFEALASLENVSVCEHAFNKGKGAALKTGFQFIKNSDADLQGVITADADGQHLAADVHKLATTAVVQPQDFILGSRTFGKETPLRSLIGNRLTAFLMRFVHGVTVSDTQTGLRYLPRALLPDLSTLPGDGYEFELQCLIKARELGYRPNEVPIETVYIDENSSSHFSPIMDSARIYSVLFRFGGSSVACFVIDIVLFAWIFWLGYGAMVATIFARIVSGVVNFLFNKFLVFKRRRTGAVIHEALGYLALWLALMLVSGTMVSLVGAQPTAFVVAIKIVVDVFSYFVQSRFVFAKKPGAVET
jgi:glycosyltransferase involved in cell wall biosynthesis